MGGGCPAEHPRRRDRRGLRGSSLPAGRRSHRRDRHPRPDQRPQPRVPAGAGRQDRAPLDCRARFVLDLARAHVRTHRPARCREPDRRRPPGVRGNAREPATPRSSSSTTCSGTTRERATPTPCSGRSAAAARDSGIRLDLRARCSTSAPVSTVRLPRRGNGASRWTSRASSPTRSAPPARLPDGSRSGSAPTACARSARPSLRQVAARAAASGAPLHLHIAEQRRELVDCLRACGVRPVRWLLDRFDVDERWCLVHATHLNDGETLRSRGLGRGRVPLPQYRGQPRRRPVPAGALPARRRQDGDRLRQPGDDQSLRGAALARVRTAPRLGVPERGFHRGPPRRAGTLPARARGRRPGRRSVPLRARSRGARRPRGARRRGPDARRPRPGHTARRAAILGISSTDRTRHGPRRMEGGRRPARGPHAGRRGISRLRWPASGMESP